MTEFPGCTDPAMKIGMHIILCVHAVWLQTHPCLQGYLGETLALAFSFASVASAPHLVTLFAWAVRYTHMYLASILTYCEACS